MSNEIKNPERVREILKITTKEQRFKYSLIELIESYQCYTKGGVNNSDYEILMARAALKLRELANLLEGKLGLEE